MSALSDAAFDYAAQGYHVIPCAPKGKTPLVNWKSYQTTQPSPAEIRQWWTDWPDANVALVLGRDVFAVDIDGPDGHRALQTHGILLPPTTPTCLTGRGVHFYFRGDHADRIALLPHVDIRGRGIVIVPPSIHATGKTYTWLTPLAGLAAPPEALVQLLRSSKSPSGVSLTGGWLEEDLGGVPEGRRDATATRLAGYLLAKGIPPGAVRQWMVMWNVRCSPPLPTSAIIKCVDSIAAKEGAHEDEVQTPESIGEFVPAVLQSFVGLRTDRLTTPLAWLNDMLDGGIEPTDYILLGSRPGIGKTALALSIARHVAGAGGGVLLVSREMGQRALTRRLICQESRVPLHVLKHGNLDPETTERVRVAGERISRLPLWLSVARTIEAVVEHVQSYAPGALRLIVVDYLQLVRRTRSDGVETRQNIDYISQELRALANRVAPVLCLSSLSRPPQDVRNFEPGMASLKESGELEHDADIVCLLMREPGAEECKFVIAKNRDGRVGRHVFKFLGETLTFTEYEETLG